MARTGVLILGGGLAGLAAACELVDRGYEVTLIERRPYLGGRASSFFHRKIGEEVDIGQHVFLRCCSAYINFLHRIGAWNLVKLQPRLAVKIRSRDGRVGTLYGSRLPGPLYLAPSFLTNPFLSGQQRPAVARAMLAALFADRRMERYERTSFGEWLRLPTNGPRLQRFWDFLILPTLNAPVENVSARMGLMVLQEAFLRKHGPDVGYARAGLSQIAARAADYIQDRGGEVLLGRGATSLVIEGNSLRGVELSDGRLLAAALFISALPPEALIKVLPEGWREHPFFARVERLSWNPIVNLHLWLDRPVMEEDKDLIAFWDSPIQWIFNRSRILDRPGPGQYLCLSLSSAWEWIDLSPEQVLQRIFPELKELFPGVGEAEIERCLVTKQRRATISVAPGMEEYRLPHRTPVENLFLAGDWTTTGWPSTMEGAVRSGLECARSL